MSRFAPPSRTRRAWKKVSAALWQLGLGAIALSTIACLAGAPAPWIYPALFALGVIYAMWTYVACCAVASFVVSRHWLHSAIGSSTVALLVVIGHALLTFSGHEADFFSGARALGYRFGVQAGFVWLMWESIRSEYDDIVGQRWPELVTHQMLSRSGLLDALKGKALVDPQKLLTRTVPRVVRGRELEVVDFGDLKMNPWLAEKWAVPQPPGAAASRRTARKVLWLLALNLGIAENKPRVCMYVDEESAVAFLRRELTEAEWAWVQRAWIALDPTVDPELLRSMHAWTWIDRLPHSERTIEAWQAYWAENVRRAKEEWASERAAELAAEEREELPAPKSPPKSAPASRPKVTQEARAALRERHRTKATLHQGPAPRWRPLRGS